MKQQPDLEKTLFFVFILRSRERFFDFLCCFCCFVLILSFFSVLCAHSHDSFSLSRTFFFSGEIVTREPLDRELKASYDLVAEARDQGTPYRSARVAVHVIVTDVNDNAPEIVDPQEDVVSVREEQPAGTEVVRIRAIDRDNGHNATITYSILKGRDSDGYGYGMFSIDAVTGLIRTRVSLDHEEHTIYRLAVAASKKTFFFVYLLIFCARYRQTLNFIR